MTRLEATGGTAGRQQPGLGLGEHQPVGRVGLGWAGRTFGETFEVTHCRGALRSYWLKLSTLLSHWFEKLSIDGHVILEFKGEQI